MSIHVATQVTIMRPSSSSSSSSSSSLCVTTSPPLRTRSPAIKTTPYCRSGIGGAGNYHKPSPSTVPGPSTTPPPQLPSRNAVTFTSGIGGAGNIHPHTARSTLDFAEEIARSRAIERNTPTTYHFGIGGAGNRAGGKRVGPDSPAQVQVPEYSNEPLPYGALDSLRRKISMSFGRSHASLASESECGEGRKEGHGVKGGLRGVWRF